MVAPVIAGDVGRESAGLDVTAFVERHPELTGKIAVPHIDQPLNISRAEVHGVLTFYHDFRRHPHGRHTLKICRAEACQSLGSEDVARGLLAKLGTNWHGTTKDGEITVLPVYCLGLCANGPSALLDEHPIARLDKERLADAMEEVCGP